MTDDLKERVANLTTKHGLVVADADAVYNACSLDFSSAVTSDDWIISELKRVSHKSPELFVKQTAEPDTKSPNAMSPQFVAFLAQKNLTFENFKTLNATHRLAMAYEFEQSVKDSGKLSARDLERKKLESMDPKALTATERTKLADMQGIPRTRAPGFIQR